MTENDFHALLRRLRAVAVSEDDADMLAVFAVAAAEVGWSEALATFADIAARHLKPQPNDTRNENSHATS